MSQFPLVSIITVNYNQSAATCDMLASLYASGYPNMEVWVVDNASPSDTPEVIKEKFPQVIFIQSDKNLGFAGGNNLALQQAQGDYFYLINNDTIVPQGHIEQLVSVLASDASVGVVSPKIKFYATPDIIQFAGYTDMTRYSFRNKSIGYGECDNGKYDQICDSAFAHGAAMMLKREVVGQTGLMNEHYFLYYEELEWSARIKKAGYRIIYVPDTYILHKESLSTGKSSLLQTYYMNRNRLLFTRCTASGSRKIIGILYQIFIAMPKNIFVELVHAHSQKAFVILKAWWWNVKNMGNLTYCSFGHI